MMIADDLRSALTGRFALGLLWLPLLVTTGCGGSSTVSLHPSTGRVLFQGKPLEGVQVTLRSIGQDGPVPSARTDQDGKFRLGTVAGEDGRVLEGAPVGEYAVTLAPATRSDSVDFLGKKDARPTANPLGLRYADPKTSGLKATIRPRVNDLGPFDLKEGGAAASGVPPRNID